MIKVFSLLALCLPLWGQSAGDITNAPYYGTSSTGIMKVVEGPVTAEDSAHQAYRLALADFALLITKGPITVDALEAAFEKIDATKMKWVMSKGATISMPSCSGNDCMVPPHDGSTEIAPTPTKPSSDCSIIEHGGHFFGYRCSGIIMMPMQEIGAAPGDLKVDTLVDLGSIPKSNGTTWDPSACLEADVDGKLMNVPCPTVNVVPIQNSGSQGGKEYSSPSYIDSEGNIMRNGMLQGRDLPKPSIDRSDAKSINRVPIRAVDLVRGEDGNYYPKPVKIEKPSNCIIRDDNSVHYPSGTGPCDPAKVKK